MLIVKNIILLFRCNHKDQSQLYCNCFVL